MSEHRKTDHFISPHSPGVLIEKWCDNPYMVIALCWNGESGPYMNPAQARAYAKDLLTAADAAEKLNNPEV